MKEGILQIVEVISNEKGIERDAVFAALEEALSIATRKKLGLSREDYVQVNMNKNTGEYTTHLLEAKNIQDLLPDDLEQDELTIDDLRDDQIIRTQLDNVTFNRVCIQTAKQIIYQKIREAETARAFSAMQARIGNLVKGTVKYIRNNGYVIQDFSHVHFFLPHSEMLNDEYFKVGDKVQAVLHDVVHERNRNRFILSRCADAFLERLMQVEVPEIAEGSIQIKSIARNPGVRAKVLVKSNDKRIDCVGACIGIRGMRAQMITNALNGERFGVVEWHEDIAQLVMNILAPIEAKSIMINESDREVFVAVSEEEYAQAIGKEGQNVQMASKLLGWRMSIVTPEELSERKAETNQDQIAQLAEALDVNQQVAKHFIKAGYTTLDDVSYIEGTEVLEELAKDIEDLDAVIAKAQEKLLLRTLQEYQQN